MQQAKQRKLQLPLWMRVLNFFAALKPRQIFLVLLSGILCASLALSLTKTLVKPIYSTTITLMIVNEQTGNESDIENLSVSYQLAQSLAAAGRNTAAAERTIARLGLEMNPETLLSKVRVARKAKSMLVRVYVIDEIPERAQAIAQVYCEELLAGVAETLSINNPQQVYGPTPPAAIGSDRGNTLFGGLVGCLLMLFVFYRRYRSGRIIRKSEDLEPLAPPVIGEICAQRTTGGGRV